MSEKKRTLINSALRLFYAQGTNSVGINEIVKVAGVTKKTLYYHFTNKEELIIATLEYRDKVISQWFENILNSKDKVEEAILAIFYELDNWFNNRLSEFEEFNGCFFINIATENNNANPAISSYCYHHKNKIKTLIKNKISTRVNNKNDVNKLTEIVFLLAEGAIVAASVSGNKNAALNCIPSLKTLLSIKES